MSRCDYRALPESIREALSQRSVRRIADADCDVRAAVCLVLSASVPESRAAGEPAVLFVRRADYAGDPWSGHMALPGGRASEEDIDLLDTARRETLEETGLRLERPDFLGRLDDIHPRSPHLPSIAITPFVAWHRGEVRVTVSRELAGYAWIPISYLAAPERRGTLDLKRPVRRTFPGIRHQGEFIWGLTFAIVEDFLRLVAGY
jgi:8-oxo-dGTP pyrophosphatase MutT (NUDIX family)